MNRMKGKGKDFNEIISEWQLEWQIEELKKAKLALELFEETAREIIEELQEDK